jgi:ABC-type spermidine/putrescine transport system permease subunit II
MLFISAEFNQIISNYSMTYSGWWNNFLIVLFAGAIVAYLFTFLLGVPLYYLFKKINMINYWSLVIGSTLIAAVPFVLTNVSARLSQFKGNLSIYSALAACGCAVGNAFYLLTRKKTPISRSCDL